MLPSSKIYREIIKARKLSILAFFVLLNLLFVVACSFDDDSGKPISQSNTRVLNAKVVKVKDGDSVILLLDNKQKKEARLFGIDAPDYRYLQKIKILGVVA